jgi:Fe-S-cluster-containing hydrogenase component 2
VKCDFCDGDPQCVRFCYAKAVSFTEANKTSVAKKREFALQVNAAMGLLR